MNTKPPARRQYGREKSPQQQRVTSTMIAPIKEHSVYFHNSHHEESISDFGAVPPPLPLGDRMVSLDLNASFVHLGSIDKSLTSSPSSNSSPWSKLLAVGLLLMSAFLMGIAGYILFTWNQQFGAFTSMTTAASIRSSGPPILVLPTSGMNSNSSSPLAAKATTDNCQEHLIHDVSRIIKTYSSSLSPNATPTGTSNVRREKLLNSKKAHHQSSIDDDDMKWTHDDTGNIILQTSPSRNITIPRHDFCSSSKVVKTIVSSNTLVVVLSDTCASQTSSTRLMLYGDNELQTSEVFVGEYFDAILLGDDDVAIMTKMDIPAATSSHCCVMELMQWMIPDILGEANLDCRSDDVAVVVGGAQQQLLTLFKISKVGLVSPASSAAAAFVFGSNDDWFTEYNGNDISLFQQLHDKLLTVVVHSSQPLEIRSAK